MKVYCNYHNQYGTCTEEDWYDAVDGRNPSRMVRVQFETFTQSVPLNSLELDNEEECNCAGCEYQRSLEAEMLEDLKNECELNGLECQTHQ